jgi:uncharacterized membrane protein YphA (DoxX/SURF4 family)
VILIRLMVGLVFLSEGVQKLLFPSLGPERFAAIGFPAPEVLAYFVACLEIAAGSLVLLGLLTRPAALLLAINISVAILSTKIPLLLGHGYWCFGVQLLPRYGFWTMSHEARTDVAMWMGSVFLLIVGAGAWSVDALITRTEAASR